MKLKLKELRIKKGLTLDDLAAKSGVSKRMISAYEADENDITLTKLQNIAMALQVSISDLLFEREIAINELSDTETVHEPNKGYSVEKSMESTQYLNQLISALNNISESVKLNAIANERNSRNMDKMIELIAEKQTLKNKQVG